MKHFFSYLAVMLLSCCTMNSEVKAEIPANEGKTLVVYYSYTGNCREIVTTLTSQIEADVLEILPAEKGLVESDGSHHAVLPLSECISDGRKARRNDCIKSLERH